MKKHIYIIAGVCAVALSLTSCSDDFLEVKNPTGEPLEEYYTTEATLNEALTAAYAPLHWPDWDGSAYNDLTVDGEIMGDDFWVGRLFLNYDKKRHFERSRISVSSRSFRTR